MKKKSLKKINRNIEATEQLIEEYENKKEELKLKPVKNLQIYSGLIIGESAGIAIMSSNLLDLGVMVIGGLAGGAIGALTPYIIKQIKIGELDYQIFMNGLIMKDLEKEKAEVSGKVKTLNK